MDITTCPECGQLAEVLRRDVLESTAGPVEHAKTLCIEGHHFLLPVEVLARGSRPRARQVAEQPRPDLGLRR